MFPGAIAEVDEAILTAACAEHWAESQTLEFKRELPGHTDRDKHEFLKDVCALANASGGDLVFGIEEHPPGQADRIAPISLSTHGIDATKRRLAQILDSGLEPRLFGIEIQPVVIAGGDYVLLVRVPASFQKPHRFFQGGHTRWVVRSDTHTVDLTYQQIRDFFDRGATIAQRARNFREERLSGVLTGTTARPLRAGPKCVVHLIPLASVAGTVTVDVRALYNGPYQDFMFPDWRGASRSLNLDGLVVFPGTHMTDVCYTQVFRSGSMEAARFVGALNVPEDERDRDVIPGGLLSDFIRDALIKFLAAAGRFNITGPAILSAAILDVGNHRFFYQPAGYYTQRNPTDRPNLILPEVWVEQLSAIQNADEFVRPLLDTLWQSFDLEGCMFYDAQGLWIRR